MNVFITDHGFPHVDREREIITQTGAKLHVAQCKTAEDVIAECGEADALLVQWAPVTSEVVAHLNQCRIIVRYGIGVDNIDLQAATARNIPVCNVPDYCIDEVSDHSLALALSLTRRLPQTDALVRQGTWKITPPTSFPAFRDTVFATAGFGRIARAVLERARGFGFQLAAYDPLVPTEKFAALGVKQLQLEELFQEAGILSLHLPLTTQTRHFIDRTRLSRMRNDAVLVNTARGGLIDTEALTEALAQGGIAGAGLDVFETEPLLGDHPLRDVPNTILTSHTAWYSGGSVPELQRKAAEEIVRGLAGLALSHPVNRV
ncbi:D-3-phosphoglycerate dehydrogenase [Terrimicrobium sacchariphilum]|uniref:D-3-phosphoglycerate dehydrogenase n=2 Tax=Terrimicrobium sacchariphilum TaxID=690879 RepID=A0A146GC42_TERSA|nr:D-3-phosphoglycerate dehydrogenase [Terrimicrobium sacchariphilum]